MGCNQSAPRKGTSVRPAQVGPSAANGGEEQSHDHDGSPFQTKSGRNIQVKSPPVPSMDKLLAACKFGRLNEVEGIIKEFGESKVTSYRGMWDNSPLIVACQYEQWAVAQRLLECGASLKHYNEKQCNAMLYTCLLGSSDKACQLLHRMLEQLYKTDQVFELFRSGYTYVPSVDGYRKLCAVAASILNPESRILEFILEFKYAVIPRCNDEGGLWFGLLGCTQDNLEGSIQTVHPLTLAASLGRWKHYALLLESWLLWYTNKSPRYTADVLSTTVSGSSCPWLPPSTNLLHLCCKHHNYGCLMQTLFVVIFSRCVHDRILPCNEDAFRTVVYELALVLLQQFLALEQIATLCATDIPPDDSFTLDTRWLKTLLMNLFSTGDYFSRKPLDLAFIQCFQFPTANRMHREHAEKALADYEINFSTCFGNASRFSSDTEETMGDMRQLLASDQMIMKLSSLEAWGNIRVEEPEDSPSKNLLADAAITLQRILESCISFPNSHRRLKPESQEMREIPLYLLRSKWVIMWLSVATITVEDHSVTDLFECYNMDVRGTINALTQSSFVQLKSPLSVGNSEGTSGPSHFFADNLTFQVSTSTARSSMHKRARSRSAEIEKSNQRKRKERRDSFVSEPEELDRKVRSVDKETILSWDVSTRGSITTAGKRPYILQFFSNVDDNRGDYLSPLSNAGGFF
eukprot:gb/GECG01015179.1/.p1 GENE.gb/GECG01015179.1/~~gb/GECG01015179.1/.p1  ORF type:complete len:689 (+),score=63.34 gb/GECG01015179.1/:1-2067(+)